MRRLTVVAALCAGVAIPVLADDGAQGFFRVVEGAATLIRVEDGQPEAARENSPALAGDRISLAPGARVEVILPDGHRLRLAESADLELAALARSLDREGEATALLLSRGALALDVPRDALDRTRVDTDAAGVVLERGGLYLIEIDDRGDTRVVVRDGEAEVLTEYDTTVVRAGEEAVIAPDDRSRVALYEAPPLTDVEEWARQLEAEAARAEVEPIEPELRYAAEPLSRYGTWVDSGAGYGWRPRVASGWRPYWMGHWTYSPAGLVWSSYEPWGWVPYHYGSWDLHPSYGWLWYPGAVYRPAHVVWYWGASHAGWVPSGYYGSFYARKFGFHVSFGSGFYGVSHAGWHAYRDWVFCPTSSIGHRHQYRFHGDHRVLGHGGRFHGNDRAFITADTRGFDRGRWRDSAAVEDVLVRRAHRRTGRGDLPDVSAVVARSPEVSGTVLRDFGDGDDRRRVASHRPAGPRGRDAGAAGETAANAGAPSTRVGPRRPAVLGEDQATRQAPGRTAVRRPIERGEVGGADRSGAASAASAAEPDQPPGRATTRAHRSPGFEPRDGAAGGAGLVNRRMDGSSRSTAGGPVDESRARPTSRVPSRRQELGGAGAETPRARPAYREPRSPATSGDVAPSRVIRRTAPGRAESGLAPSPRPQRRVVESRATSERPAPAASSRGERPGVERGAPVTRANRERAVVGRSAPAARVQPERVAPSARVEREGPVVDRSAAATRSYGGRAPMQRAAPPRARVESSYAPRSAPSRARVEPSYAPPSAPSRARVESSYAPRSAPSRARVESSYAPRSAPPRARVESSYAPRSAPPRARVESSYAPRSAPSRARVESSYAPRSAPVAPRVMRDPRPAPAARSAPSVAPRRMESPRPAPAARSGAASAPARASGGGDGSRHHARSGAQSRDGGSGGGRGGGGAHARSRRH